MAENDYVPEPVLFNCLKHHLEYIRYFIAISATQDILLLPKRLNIIGESQMDLYTGDLSPAEIAYQVIEYLKERQLHNKESYTSWLQLQQSSYASLQLSDNTTLILRIGEQPNRYIHIHPGRYAAHTLRVKANAWKTAIAVSVWQRVYQMPEISLSLMNEVRKQLLQVSPVKSISATEGIVKLLYLLNKN